MALAWGLAFDMFPEIDRDSSLKEMGFVALRIMMSTRGSWLSAAQHRRCAVILGSPGNENNCQTDHHSWLSRSSLRVIQTLQGCQAHILYWLAHTVSFGLAASDGGRIASLMYGGDRDIRRTHTEGPIFNLTLKHVRRPTPFRTVSSSSPEPR